MQPPLLPPEEEWGAAGLGLSPPKGPTPQACTHPYGLAHAHRLVCTEFPGHAGSPTPQTPDWAWMILGGSGAI